MPVTDRGTLGPGFERRLNAALDAVVPPSPHVSAARYQSKMPPRAHWRWRLAPALVGIGAVAIIALSAVAATGSPNPVVWTQRAASTIQSVSHIPEPSPNQPQSPTPDQRSNAPVSQATQSPDRQAEPSEKAQPSERPEESPQPEPTERPSPSPEPSDSHGQVPTPSPSPHE